MSSAVAPSAPLALREYQVGALEAIARHYAAGVQRCLVSLPTGTGKSIVFASLPEYLHCERMEVVLVVAHVDELITQAAAAFERVIPDAWIDVEKAARESSPMARIVVASVQTLRGRRMDAFFARFAGRIKVLVIDEAHRSTAKSYRDLIDAFFAARPDGLLVGVTATPKRSDNVGLDKVYDKTVFHLDIRQAIDGGWLVPIEAYRVTTTTSLEAIKVRAGDYAQDELAKAVDTEARNRSVVQSYLEYAWGRKAIVFAASVEHAQHLSDRFNAASIPAAAIWGELSDGERKGRIAAFRRGDLNVLTGYQVLVEGLDVPGIEAVILARPTRSGVIYRQALGRGLRPHESIASRLVECTDAAARRALIEASPKPAAIVLDVVDVTRRHSLITLPSLFGLPPKMDLQGRRVPQVVEEFEQLAMRDPKAALDIKRVDEIGIAIQRADLFAIPEIPPEVTAAGAEFTWVALREGVWRLSLPSFTTACDRDGKPIERFDARVRAFVREHTGEDDATAAAYESLRVDRASLRHVDGAVEIRTDPLNQYEVWRLENGREKQLGVVSEFPEAFSRAEAWITKAYAEVLLLIQARASWQSGPRTEGQTWKLRRLGVPKDKMPARKGDASRLIDRLEHRRAEGMKRPWAS